MLVDTHAHIQFADFPIPLTDVLALAKAAEVERIMAVGVDVASSRLAIDLASQYEHIYATVGLHPHDAAGSEVEIKKLRKLAVSPKVVAVGECGLDYSREHDAAAQARTFRAQVEIALEYDLPLVFHVHDAFPDFFKIIDDYPKVRGLVHCFNGTTAELEPALERGLFIALNGIMTFTKNPDQLIAAKSVPLDRLLLETDCPFLAPKPHRGQPNQPAFVRDTAGFLAELRGESFDDLAQQTTKNAKQLFGLT